MNQSILNLKHLDHVDIRAWFFEIWIQLEFWVKHPPKYWWNSLYQCGLVGLTVPVLCPEVWALAQLHWLMLSFAALPMVGASGKAATSHQPPVAHFCHSCHLLKTVTHCPQTRKRLHLKEQRLSESSLAKEALYLRSRHWSTRLTQFVAWLAEQVECRSLHFGFHWSLKCCNTVNKMKEQTTVPLEYTSPGIKELLCIYCVPTHQQGSRHWLAAAEIHLHHSQHQGVMA